jgi:hypothetical protein
VIYMIALLDLLRDAGGALPSPVVYAHLRASGRVPPSDLATIQSSGETRFAKEVRFARLELVHAGLLNLGTPGQWSLSETGWGTFLTPAEAQALIRQRRHGTKLNAVHALLPGPTTGPRPTAYTATVVRTVTDGSYAYAFRFGSADLWKIGHAQDVDARLVEVNRHVPVELLGLSWSIFARHACADSLAAHRLEQQLLGELSDRRTQGERVQCSRERLILAWRRHCVAANPL